MTENPLLVYVFYFYFLEKVYGKLSGSVEIFTTLYIFLTDIFGS